MAKNTRTTHGRESLKPKMIMPDERIDDATPAQLLRWLTHPPRSDLLRTWRSTPWPLKRAVELERFDLFEAWVNHGCRPTSTLTLGDPLVCKMGKNTSTFLDWVAQTSPNQLIEVLRQLRFHHLLFAGGHTRNMNWNKILGTGMLSSDIILGLATEAVAGGMEGLPAQQLLEATGGKIADNWALKNTLSSYLNSRNAYTGHYVFDSDRDQHLAKKINQLPMGLLNEANIGLIAGEGGLLSASALSLQLSMTVEDWEINPPKKYSCQSYQEMFKAWNQHGKRSEHELKEALDAVIPHIDWRKRDRKGNTPLHVLNLPQWPALLVRELVEEILSVRENMMEQKNKAGLTPTESEDNTADVREFLTSYKRRADMNHRLRHNVRQTQAVREATRPAAPAPAEQTQAPEAVRARRPFM